LIVKKLVIQPFMANCFIVGCEHTKKAAVIDPGGSTDKILLSLAESQLKLEYIINTHGHVDHASGNRKLKDATGADILIHSLDAPMLEHLSQSAAMFGISSENSPPPDRTLADNDTVTIGDITLKVIHTPGHSPGGISLYADGKLFVGDTLFQGSIGRTDLPGGDFGALISSVQNKLFPLGDEIQVYTGHGPETTIATEKKYNPFVGIGSV